jgi:hypothetical protein
MMATSWMTKRQNTTQFVPAPDAIPGATTYETSTLSHHLKHQKDCKSPWPWCGLAAEEFGSANHRLVSVQVYSEANWHRSKVTFRKEIAEVTRG